MLKNEPQISRRPIKEDIIFKIKFFLGNEPQIGRIFFKRKLTNFIKNMIILFQNLKLLLKIEEFLNLSIFFKFVNFFQNLRI